MFRGYSYALAVQVLGACAATAQTAPAAITPPAESTLIASHFARGVQIYACSVKAGAPTWVLKAPEADLTDASGRPFAHHSAGPSWQATDGSKVVGTLLAKVSAPDPDAIAWLLLSAKASGPGVLGKTRFVQRLDTRGGNAPRGACTVGQEVRVPYSARYAFYR